MLAYTRDMIVPLGMSIWPPVGEADNCIWSLSLRIVSIYQQHIVVWRNKSIVLIIYSGRHF